MVASRSVQMTGERPAVKTVSSLLDAHAGVASVLVGFAQSATYVCLPWSADVWWGSAVGSDRERRIKQRGEGPLHSRAIDPLCSGAIGFVNLRCGFG